MKLLAWSIVLAGLVLTATALWQLPEPPRAETRPLLSIEFEQQRHTLNPLDGLRLERQLRTRLDSQGQALMTRLEAHLEQELDRYFQAASDRIPEFADWYFSLGAEYTRISLALLVRAGLADGSELARMVQERLFGEPGPELWLEVLQADLLHDIQAHQRTLHADWTREMRDWLQQRNQAGLAGVPRAHVDLQAFSATLIGHDSFEFALRQTGAGTAATGTGALLLTRAALSRSASGAAAGRASGRLLGRGGSAAGGALICAPTGPLVLGCAVASGVAAWLAVDWGLLRLDEQRQREALEQELEDTLQELRDQLGRELHSLYEHAMLNRQKQMRVEIDRTFVPARRLWGQDATP